MGRRLVALLCSVGIALVSRTVDACTGVSATLYHTVDGGFIIPERGRAAAGPRITFWQFGQYAQFNSGTQEQWQSDGSEPWLVHVLTQYQANGLSTAVDPDLYRLSQADWAGPNIVGCPYDLPHEQRRTVVELTMPQATGSSEHYTVYLIASVGFDISVSSFNFDNVVGGNGGRPADVRTQPIPVPQIAGAGLENPIDARYMNVALTLPAAKSFGDAGAPNLIYGYNIYYMNDQAPVSNFAPDYQRVRDAGNPQQELASVPYGSTVVMVAVKKPTVGTYFVTQLVYADTTAVLVSGGVSGNSQMVPVFGTAVSDKEPTAGSTPPHSEAGGTPEGKPEAGAGREAVAEGRTREPDTRRETIPKAAVTPANGRSGEPTGTPVASVSAAGTSPGENGGVVGSVVGTLESRRSGGAGRREGNATPAPGGDERVRSGDIRGQVDRAAINQGTAPPTVSPGVNEPAQLPPPPGNTEPSVGGTPTVVATESGKSGVVAAPGRDGAVSTQGIASTTPGKDGLERAPSDTTPAALSAGDGPVQLAEQVKALTGRDGVSSGVIQRQDAGYGRNPWWYLDAAFLAALSALGLMVLRGRGLVG